MIGFSFTVGCPRCESELELVRDRPYPTNHERAAMLKCTSCFSTFNIAVELLEAIDLASDDREMYGVARELLSA